MTNQNRPAVGYAREVPRPPDDVERFVYLLEKWEKLEEALASDAKLLVVAFPEVLGDNYTELLINLGKVAQSRKMLVITRASPFLKEDRG